MRLGGKWNRYQNSLRYFLSLLPWFSSSCPSLSAKTVQKRFLKEKKDSSYVGKEEREDTGCQLYIYRKIIPGFK